MAPFKAESINFKQHSILKPQRSPATRQTIELPMNHKKRPECLPLPVPVVLEQDQILTLRDKTKIRADVYRLTSSQKVPAILMWDPLSRYEDFERFDPAESVPSGYATINTDSRDVGNSDDNLRFWGTSESQDGYNVVEKIAKLPWYKRKVGMTRES
ncbi:hypothetical protein B0J11DRAFT_571630 [Dendryphion nanum]|uniref:Xaa-Pro dipeptidyl-peptidase-like domain-containing protein n=1 Tax=Dendryphion nanum TaxID=256645 RepID=A0A9P9IDU9_9PLEO|nr:hypothetical protein B0J11DRAFT_571630 [Dendryphion nanum]